MRKPSHNQDILNHFRDFNSEHDSWSICVNASGEISTHRINFLRLPLTTKSIGLAKHFLAIWLDEHNYNENNPARQTFIKFSARTFVFLALFEKNHLGKSISELEKPQLERLCALAMFHKIRFAAALGIGELCTLDKPLSINVITSLVTMQRYLYRLFHEGKISDGPEYRVTQPRIKQLLAEDFKTLEVDFYIWQQGGSYGSIPFPVANLLLADAIEIINSSISKQLLSYFRIFRTTGRFDLAKKLWTTTNNKIRQYRYFSDPKLLTKKFGGDPRETKDCKRLILLPLHSALTEINGSSYTFPWPRYIDFISDYNLVTSACYIIFLSIMGKRGPSEVLTLCANDVTLPPETPGNATVYSTNHKTNKGVRSGSGVSDFVQLACDTLFGLCYIHKAPTNFPLFSTLPILDDPSANPVKISKGHSNRLLLDYYDSFIDRVSPKVELDIRQIHPTIGTHQFRHTFAEFALRRFDGNVEELIRQAFQHGFNYSWIKRYTANKLDADVTQLLNRAYILDLIPRVLSDLDSLAPEFVGGMAVYIKKVIQPQTQHMSPSELEVYLELFSNHLISITPHEYGWCVLLRELSNQAKCSEDGINPSPQSTCSGKCNSCINFLSSRSSHRDVQQVILLSHIDFIECDTWRQRDLKQASINAVRNAQRLFPEFKEYGEY